MSPQVKVTGNKDFDETLAHLPAPPAPSLLYESQLSPSSAATNAPSSTSLSLLDDEDYNSFYNAIPTTADALYTSAPTGLSPTSTSSSGAYSTTSSAVSSSSYAAPWQPAAAFSSTSLLLGSSTRTPMQLVNISNIKLNNDIFSSKSLSIHRRILVKNLLTLLYETHPMLNWFDDGHVTDDGGYAEEGQDTSGEPLLGEDEQNGWMEQTLNAAGLAEDDEDDEDDDDDNGHGANGQHRAPDSDSDSEDDLERGYVHISIAKKASASSVSLPQGPSYTARNPAFAISTPNLTTPQSKSTKATAGTAAAAAAVSPPLPPLPIPSTPSSRTPYTPSPASSGSKNSNSTPTPSAAAAASPSNKSKASSQGALGSGQKSPRLGPSHGLPQAVPRTSKEPLPRPKSVELPQSLNNYLSAVFDVDWSVGLSLTEDSLFTLTNPGASSGNGPVPSAAVAAAAKRRSIVSSSPMAMTSNLASMPSSTTSSSSLGSPILGSSPRAKRISRVPVEAGVMGSGSKADNSPDGPIYGSSRPLSDKDHKESSRGVDGGISNNVSSNGQSGSNWGQPNATKPSPALPVTANDSAPPAPRKTLVPGRRSSLMHSTQSNNAASGPNGIVGGNKVRSMATRHESHSNDHGESNKFTTSPPSHPVSTASNSVSGGQFAAGFNSNGSDSALPRQGSPSYSRRTSSLPSAAGSSPDSNSNKPMGVQRNLSSDHILLASKSGQGNSQGVLKRSSTANTFAPQSPSSSTSGLQHSNSRNPPQAPRHLSILPMSNQSNQRPVSPPRSPSRAGATTNGSGPSMTFSSPPVLPPLFPLPEPPQQKPKTQNGYGHQQLLSPPSSPGSNGFMSQPTTYLLSQSDEQPRLLSPPTSPGMAAVPSSRPTRAVPNFGSKSLSMSSPDLVGSTAGSGYNHQTYHSQQHRPLPSLPEQNYSPKDRRFDANGNTRQELEPPAYVDLGFRTLSRSSSRRVSSGNGGISYQDSQFPYPSPSQGQHSYQNQQSSRSLPNGGPISAPLPQIPSMYPQNGGHHNHSRDSSIASNNSNSSNSNRSSTGKNSGQRWSSMKNMLKIKANSGR